MNSEKSTLSTKNSKTSRNMTENILEFKNVTKKYGNVIAVNDVSFVIKKGERVGLIGANGAGKTTISEMIVGINNPTLGKVEYGFDYVKFPQEKIGMQFQDSIYPTGLSVKAIVRFAKMLHKIDISNEEVMNLLKIFQMEDFYYRTSRSLSGGQRQKLNILLSILHNPEIVILDEISTGLDLSAREEIIKFVDKLLNDRGITAILVSHHMEEIERLCSRVIVLDRGKILLSSTIPEINKKYGSLSKLMKSVIDNSNNTQHEIYVKKEVEKSRKNIFKRGQK